MDNLFKKIKLFFLSNQEKDLSKKLDKHLQTSSTNLTSKTVISTAYTMTLDLQTQKNIEVVNQQISDMLKRLNYDAIKLLEYAHAKGTPVFKLKDAPKKLAKLGLEEGLIFELDGMNALKLNLMLKAGFSFKTVPMFIMDDKPLEPYFIYHQFYKWYSYYRKLPGFDKTSQMLFRLSMQGKIDMAKLTLQELTGLKEAIRRDKEATDYTLVLVKEQETAKKLKEEGSGNA